MIGTPWLAITCKCGWPVTNRRSQGKLLRIATIVATFAAAVAGSLYLGMRLGGSNRQTQTQSVTAQATAQPMPKPTPPSQQITPADPPSIEGTWVFAERGGEDGQTVCGDYARPALYKRNGNMGEVSQFAADGSYRSYFAYTTPSGEEHYTQYSANWQQVDSKLVLLNYDAQDAFRDEAPRLDRKLRFESRNVVRIDDRRYVRCIGETGLDDGQ